MNDLVGTFSQAALQLSPADTTADLVGSLLNSQAFGGTAAIAEVPYPGPVVTVKDDGTGNAVTVRPPNNRWQSFTLADCATAIDRCGVTLSPNDAGEVKRITSDEDAGACTATSNNQCVADGAMKITGRSSFDLLRDRDGKGNGRIYTITFDMSDSAGNTTRSQCRIQVPHDNSGPNASDSGTKSCIGDGC
jgi:hypothetical protein